MTFVQSRILKVKVKLKWKRSSGENQRSVHSRVWVLPAAQRRICRKETNTMSNFSSIYKLCLLTVTCCIQGRFTFLHHVRNRGDSFMCRSTLHLTCDPITNIPQEQWTCDSSCSFLSFQHIRKEQLGLSVDWNTVKRECVWVIYEPNLAQWPIYFIKHLN